MIKRMKVNEMTDASLPLSAWGAPDKKSAQSAGSSPPSRAARLSTSDSCRLLSGPE